MVIMNKNIRDIFWKENQGSLRLSYKDTSGAKISKWIGKDQHMLIQVLYSLQYI